MALLVRPCHSPRAFLDVQRRFYRGDPHYVPPLTMADAWQVDRRKNPFFEHADVEMWIAYDQGKPVGRISATRDHLHDQFHGDRIGFFGHFEAQHAEATRALLDTAATWLQQRGAEHLRGPIDLSTNYRCGLLVEDKEPGPPVLMMAYNPPHYRPWLEACGLVKAKDLLALLLETQTATPERFLRIVARVVARTGATIRSVRLDRFAVETDLLWRLYLRIWERNWGFVPMSEGEFRRSAREMRLVVKPDLLTVVEVGGEPVGFAMNVPDVNVATKACNGRLLPFGWWRFWRALRRTTRTRVLTLGVLPEWRKNGIDALLLHYYWKRNPELGYPQCEASWILEDNVEMLRVLESLGAREYRRYRILQKAL